MTPTPNTTLYATVVKLVVTQDRPPFAPKARTIKWRVSKFWLGCDSGWNTCQHNGKSRGFVTDYRNRIADEVEHLSTQQAD